MRRADRLLQIVQALRRHRGSITAAALAEELEVASRTIYRDIATLQAARVPIDGEAGVGYVLRKGYDLPPMMFTSDEVDAIVLGARMVIERGDPALGRAAEDVMAKIREVLPATVSAQMWKATDAALRLIESEQRPPSLYKQPRNLIDAPRQSKSLLLMPRATMIEILDRLVSSRLTREPHPDCRAIHDNTQKDDMTRWPEKPSQNGPLTRQPQR